jgi:hypothetical protein
MATKLSEQGGIDLHGGFGRQMMIHSGLVSFGLVWFCWMEMMLWLMLDVVDRQTYLINWSSESVISRVSRRHQSRNAETVTNATPNAQRARSRQGTEFLDGMDVP